MNLMSQLSLSNLKLNIEADENLGGRLNFLMNKIKKERGGEEATKLVLAAKKIGGQSIPPSQTAQVSSAEKRERMRPSAAQIMMDAAKSGKYSKRDAATSPIREPSNLISAGMYVDESIPAEKMDPAQKILENYFKPEDAQNSQPNQNSKKRSIYEITQKPDVVMRSVSPSPSVSRISAVSSKKRKMD